MTPEQGVTSNAPPNSRAAVETALERLHRRTQDGWKLPIEAGYGEVCLLQQAGDESPLQQLRARSLRAAVVENAGTYDSGFRTRCLVQRIIMIVVIMICVGIDAKEIRSVVGHAGSLVLRNFRKSAQRPGATGRKMHCNLRIEQSTG